MALKIDTDSLKKVSNVVIECRLMEQLGIQIFNNLGTVSEEYTELCLALGNACEQMMEEVGKLRLKIPTA